MSSCSLSLSLWVFADLVMFLQVSVQLLQTVQVKLLLQLDRFAQVLQHLLREATREAAADLIDHCALQPYVPLSQQPVPQVVPKDRDTVHVVVRFTLSSDWCCTGPSSNL